MKINCIVVEDEPLAMERTVAYISKIPALQLQAQFDNAMDAFAYLKMTSIDLLFLDINLGELSGIQLLESIQFRGDVIIITAYPEFALQGYELNVTDYLLKPFTFERFLQAVSKVQLPHTSPQEQRDFCFIKTANKLEKIFYSDILYIEGKRDYRKIHTVKGNIMTLQTFAEMEKDLPATIICRVHKSYMVAVAKINSIEKDQIQIGAMSIPISDSYKKEFYSIIGR